MGWESAAAWLVCPHCDPDSAPAGLFTAGATLRCAGGHSFDVAADGHVNLLPAQRRLPDTVGDSKAMLLARRRFLDGGHYAPLSEALNRLVSRHLANAPPASGQLPGAPAKGRSCRGMPRPGAAILDVGCGEGYYLGRLQHHLARWPVYPFGVDVAKAGLSLAARRHREAHFVVADGAARLPFATGTVQVLLSVFAPRHPAEFGRVLAPAGLLLVVIPTPDHLREVRAALPMLDIEADKERHIVERLAPGFQLTGTTTLEYELSLSPTAVANLVGMTPGARRGGQVAPGAGDLRTPVGFTLLAFGPRG